MTDTITLPRSVVEQALEALNATMATHGKREWIEDAKQQANVALRSALEHPDIGNPVSLPAGWKLVPIKPTPVMVQAWLDAYEGNIQTVYRAMIAAAPQPPVVEQPQGEQEPVAWIENIGGGVSYNPYHEAARKLPDGVRFDLYTHPQPKRQPLTDEQIRKIGTDLPEEHRFHSRMFARAIERAHGIGGEV